MRAAATAQTATLWPRRVRGRSRRLVTLPYDVVVRKTYTSVRGTIEGLSAAAYYLPTLYLLPEQHANEMQLRGIFATTRMIVCVLARVETTVA